jgi:hypothetical protein
VGLAAGVSVARDLFAYGHSTGAYMGSLLTLGALVT